jgi:ferredoxin
LFKNRRTEIYIIQPLIKITLIRSFPSTLKSTLTKELIMAHKISDACLACGTCLPECPVEAISEGDPIYVIDAAKCTDCGACAESCPANAIQAE